MQGLILAAGMGKRLKDLTQNNTKCMVKVNGVTLIERVLRQLDGLGLKRIVIVTGYEHEKLMDYISRIDINTSIDYVHNPIFDKTNNIYSLALAKQQLKEDDTLLLESDLIFEDGILEELLEDPRETLALVDKYESWMDGTCIRIDEDDQITAFVPGKRFRFEDAEHYYKTVNVYKFSKHFSEKYYVPFLDAYSSALGNNEYYEQVLKVITMLDEPVIRAKRLCGKIWYEIDDIQDLDIAESIFSNKEEKVKKIQTRYGGYWRYPSLSDFCYLVNPYYPPRQLLDEIKAMFDKLIIKCPSGRRVNCLLAAKMLGIKTDYVIVDNSSTELIDHLFRLQEFENASIGCVFPTFEEYPIQGVKDRCTYYHPDNDGFRYSADDIIRFFDVQRVECLCIVNPDNPSGNYLDKKSVMKILTWTKENSMNLIVDESFLDYSDETDASLIQNSILDTYRNLIVIKSLSITYGVPGVRLSSLISGNSNVISSLKSRMSQWSLNSFAEYYLQTSEKYKNDFKRSLEGVRIARTCLHNEISKIRFLHVYPSQGNYLMCEVKGITSSALTQVLLNDYNILIKDISMNMRSKNRNYVRIAICGAEDNQKLIRALKEIDEKFMEEAFE